MAASPQVRCVVTWAYCMAITSISLFPSITCRVQGLLSREELRNPIRLHQDVERDTCKLFKKASKVCHLSVLPTLKGAHIHIHIHIHTHMYTHTHTHIYTHIHAQISIMRVWQNGPQCMQEWPCTPVPSP